MPNYKKINEFAETLNEVDFKKINEFAEALNEADLKKVTKNTKNIK